MNESNHTYTGPSCMPVLQPIFLLQTRTSINQSRIEENRRFESIESQSNIHRAVLLCPYGMSILQPIFHFKHVQCTCFALFCTTALIGGRTFFSSSTKISNQIERFHSFIHCICIFARKKREQKRKKNNTASTV
jgi:hypothetical protein